jgi:proteasome assembly chaperone (PAC2) family protein
MASDYLVYHAHPRLSEPSMVMGLSGWMDGGEVSTGLIATLVGKLGAQPLADIHSEGFYILNFPGSMEISSLFRPHVKIEEGLVTAFRGPTNSFFFSETHDLILFTGKEPNLNWSDYCACLLEVVAEFGVKVVYFAGSVAGLVPHTREPRLFASVSDESLKPILEQMGIRFSDYEGPASLVTYLTRLAADRGLKLVSLVAETPAYVQGRNHRCIEAVARRLAGMLNIQLNLDDLRALGDAVERRIDELVAKNEELSNRIRSLEEDYDNEVFDTQMGDLKEWLEERGIRLD